MRLRHLLLAPLAACLAPAAATAALPSGFTDSTLVTGFNQPASMAFLPDGRILVVEQNTRGVRLVLNGALHPTALLTIADVNTSGNERGLLGVAVDPDWPDRPYVYFYFDRTPGNVIYISRYTVTGDLGDPGSSSLTFGDRYDILTDIPDNANNHNGGTLRFGPDGMLYASVGEDADPCAAQDSTSLKGVILRLDVSGLPSGAGGPPAKSLITPADNPFPSTPDDLGLVFCYGLRNPFRMTIDTATGGVVIGDVGQSTYEEVSLGFGGENFGWPWREGPAVRTQSGCLEPGGSGSNVYDPPIAWYDRSSFSPASVIAGPRYRHAASPGGAYLFPAAYDGVVFFSEYYQGFVRAVKDTGGAWAPHAASGQPNATDWGTGITFVGDWLQGRDGGLYYLKQFPGELHRIGYSSPTGVGNDPEASGLVPRAAPNPFRAGSGTAVLLGTARIGAETVEVLDARGRLVRRLRAPAGGAENEAVRWDGRDEGGNPAAPGVYFVTARGPGGRETVRVTLVP